MNVVRVSDGLGNQMFQYAFARKLQIVTGKKVWLDIRFINNEDVFMRGDKNRYLYEKNDLREYGLDKFRINLSRADRNMLKFWNYILNAEQGHHKLFAMVKKKLWPWKCSGEPDVKSGLNAFFPTYYMGYFFDLGYYDDIKDILQKEFTLKEKIVLPKELGRILKQDNTVSIHVRRGDFLEYGRDISQTGYYPKALSVIKRKVDNPIYLVFSDDIEWVKKNLEIEGDAIYISGMGFQDYEELMIMKHCKNNIIANSTYSYWAAYLNPNTDKVVIYPGHWNRRIIPKGWLRL